MKCDIKLFEIPTLLSCEQGNPDQDLQDKRE